jgi:putative endonuclease
MTYYIYIITNKWNTVLYIGVTDNIHRRIYEHKNKLVQGFSNTNNLNKLIYFEEYRDIKEAIRKEKQLKNWHRDWKFNLIKSKNPDLKDLIIGS